MKTINIARLLNVQHELVRDAAGELYQRCSATDTFTGEEFIGIMNKLIVWGKIRA